MIRLCISISSLASSNWVCNATTNRVTGPIAYFFDGSCSPDRCQPCVLFVSLFLCFFFFFFAFFGIFFAFFFVCVHIWIHGTEQMTTNPFVSVCTHFTTTVICTYNANKQRRKNITQNKNTQTKTHKQKKKHQKYKKSKKTHRHKKKHTHAYTKVLGHSRRGLQIHTQVYAQGMQVIVPLQCGKSMLYKMAQAIVWLIQLTLKLKCKF